MSAAALAFVALGANLNHPLATLQAAARQLASRFDLHAASSLYRTTPLGLIDQPDFINAVLALHIDKRRHSPLALLHELFAIESAFGRQRSQPNAPRTLDLDLLLYDQLSLDSSELTLPHPRMHSRAFVLVPLMEIAPECCIPGRGLVRELLPGCLDQSCQRLAEPLIDLSAPAHAAVV